LKIVLFDGKAQYICERKRSRGAKKFRIDDKLMEDDQVLQFAEDAFDKYKATGATITSYLTRVDIMQLSDGTLVVNEFENMDAEYLNKKGIIDMKGSLVTSLMATHLSETVTRCLAKLYPPIHTESSTNEVFTFLTSTEHRK
jgi:hypothetical protein